MIRFYRIQIINLFFYIITHSTKINPPCKMDLPNYREDFSMQKSSFEQNGGTYRQVGDYLLPNLILSEKEETHTGIWGQRHKDYLRKHNPILYNIMIT